MIKLMLIAIGTSIATVGLILACSKPPTSSPPSPPDPPTGVIVTNSSSSTSLIITWNGVSGATSYKAYRATSVNGPFAKEVYNDTNNGFEDTGLLPGTTYFYEVVAVGSGGTSVFTAAVVGTTSGAATGEFSLAGTITLNGAGLSGVTVSAGSASATTNTSGSYTISGLAGSTYTVKPSLSGYTFSPATTTVTVGGANVTNIDFTATPPPPDSYSISGIVRLNNGASLAGVTVSAGSASATTNSSGSYTISGLSNGTYTVTPSRSGYTFSPATKTVTVSGANVASIDFSATAPVSYFSLTTSISPAGGGWLAISPAGSSYQAGTQVTLTENTYSGYAFTGWSGNASGTSKSITITMNGNMTITANFVRIYTLSTSVSPSGAGWLSISPAGGSYQAGTQVTLTENTYSGYAFTGWSGNASGSSQSVTVTMDGNKSVTANFTRMFTLTVMTAGGGTVTSSPGGISCPPGSTRTATFPEGTPVTLTASSNGGHTFYQWSGGLSGSSPQNMLIMNGNQTVTATFATVWSATTTQDAYVVDRTAMLLNYGTGTDLEVGTIVRVGIDYHSRTLLDFPVSDNIPAGATVLKATLRTYVISNSGTAFPFDIWIGVPLSSWSAPSVTWVTQPQIGYDSGTTYQIKAGVAYYQYFPVSAQVQAMVNGRLNYGLALVETNDLSNSTTRQFGIAALEYASSLAAQLTVEYLP